MNITTPSKYSHALMTSHNGVIIKEGAIIQEDNGTVVVWLDPVRFAVCFLCPTAPHIVKTWSLWKLGGRCCSGGEQSKKDFWSCCMNALSFKGKKREDRCLLAVLLKKKIKYFCCCLFWYFNHLMSNPVQEGCMWGENLITPLLTSLYWQGQAGALSEVQSWKRWKERPQLTVSNVPHFIWI